MKSISIIVPIYYGEKYIPKIIQQIEDCKSRLNEEDYLELLFVNDAPDAPLSQDLKSDAVHLTVINTDKNIGIHGARVKGLKKCHGEYVLFLDQDDRIYPEYFYSQLLSIEENDAVICKAIHAGEEYYSGNQAFQNVISKEFVLSHWNQIISPGQVLIRKCAIPDVWMENIMEYNGADDWLLWLCMLAGGCLFSLNENVLYEHVSNGANTSGDVVGMAQPEHEVIRIVRNKKLFQEEDLQLLMEGFFLRNLVRVREMRALKKKLDFFDKWMRLREQSVTYSEYLSSLGIQSVVIYGCGIVGQHLLSELKPSICVKGFIDRNGRDLEAEIPIYTWKDKWPETDGIIITLIEGEENVEKDIRERTDKRVLVFKKWIMKTEL